MSNSTIPFLDEITAIVSQYLQKIHYKLFLFGSRATGESTAYSDYDLAILASDPIPLSTLSVIREALEALPMLQKIDLIDLQMTSEEFKTETLQYSLLLDEH